MGRDYHGVVLLLGSFLLLTGAIWAQELTTANDTADHVKTDEAPGDVSALQSSSLPRGIGKTMPADLYADMCHAEVKMGPCRASMPRYFYNRTSQTCQRFIYGGCRGNKNNYRSEAECHSTCGATVIPVPKIDVTSEYNEYCMAEPETGLCRGAFPSFYFDPRTQNCLPFIYGGCQGNQNRYSSVEECMSRCQGKQGHFDGHFGHWNHLTPAFIMATALAVMSGMLVIGLILLTFKKYRLRMSSAHSDQDFLLPKEQSADKA
ncbi:kunitz-type protease inhibitor 2 isoform X2 [Amia ocellicauda]|uniref:kunitz-type protease inhibitor 2 isoform X2 n=1 Tax=Amia ocellicauda TaxID=2972642 RepID=UPI003464D3D7